MAPDRNWHDVSRTSPCAICSKPDRCQRTADGAIRCFRIIEPRPGYRVVKRCSDGTAIFRPTEDRVRSSGSTRRTPPEPKEPARDWSDKSAQFTKSLTDDRLNELANELGVSPDALRAIGVGQAGRAWTFPERCGAGDIIGIATRRNDRTKGFLKGGKRGLIVPTNLDSLADPVLIPEGASDVAACLTLSLAAVGRPSNRGGVDHLAELLKGREVLVIGENDRKVENRIERWPGREGAEAVARGLAKRWGKPVSWSLPPAEAKDLRAWVNQRNVKPTDAEECAARGRELLSTLLAGAIEVNIDDDRASDDKVEKRGPSQATILVQLGAAADLFHHGDDAYTTIVCDGHAETWRIGSKKFRRWLARLYFEQEGRAPGGRALQDAITVIEGKAIFQGPEHEVFVRLAQVKGTIWLDLCDEKWQAIEITSAGWRVVADPLVRFRRAKAMKPLPLPVRGGSLGELRSFVNVADDEDFALYVGWLIGALRPGKPVPVLAPNGEQGSAKSTACRFARELVDPNTAPLRCEPREPRDLMIAANNSLIVALDNLSHVRTWLSDALCRLSTGGGFSTRTLYENDEETIFDALRPVIINGIGELATRSDLLDRTINLTLPAIPDDRRRTEADLWREFEEARPRILGALLDAVSMALRRVDKVKLDRPPRMADFAQWVVAAEPACPWRPGLFLTAYTDNCACVHELALEGSPVADGVRAFAETDADWTGTASELMKILRARAGHDLMKPPPKDWPQRPNGLSNTLRRLAPSLRAIGVGIHFHPRTRQGRLISMRRLPQNIVTAVTDRHTQSQDHENADRGDDGVTASDDRVTILNRQECPLVTHGDDRDDDLQTQSNEEIGQWTL